MNEQVTYQSRERCHVGKSEARRGRRSLLYQLRGETFHWIFIYFDFKGDGNIMFKKNDTKPKMNENCDSPMRKHILYTEIHKFQSE